MLSPDLLPLHVPHIARQRHQVHRIPPLPRRASLATLIPQTQVLQLDRPAPRSRARRRSRTIRRTRRATSSQIQVAQPRHTTQAEVVLIDVAWYILDAPICWDTPVALGADERADLHPAPVGVEHPKRRQSVYTVDSPYARISAEPEDAETRQSAAREYKLGEVVVICLERISSLITGRRKTKGVPQ